MCIKYSADLFHLLQLYISLQKISANKVPRYKNKGAGTKMHKFNCKVILIVKD